MKKLFGAFCIIILTTLVILFNSNLVIADGPIHSHGDYFTMGTTPTWTSSNYTVTADDIIVGQGSFNVYWEGDGSGCTVADVQVLKNGNVIWSSHQIHCNAINYQFMAELGDIITLRVNTYFQNGACSLCKPCHDCDLLTTLYLETL